MSVKRAGIFEVKLHPWCTAAFETTISLYISFRRKLFF